MIPISRARYLLSPLLATLTLSSTKLTDETVTDLQVSFALKNGSKAVIDPKITESVLIIDGKPFEQSAMLFGNGPRDARFSALPPGDKIEFTYPLGYYFRKPGKHVLVWRGKTFEEVKIDVDVAKEANPWKVVATGPWARVSVERAIYKKSGRDRFFVRVKIDNLTKEKLGFENTNRYTVFYPNQWAEAETPRRQVISEMRRNQNEFTEAERHRLIIKYCDAKEKNIIKLAPHSTYEYFISFNSGDYKKAEAVKLPYMIVVMDGRIGFTDGKAVQTLRRDMNDCVLGEVPIATPVQLREMPAKANVLFDD